jgi:anti-sigma factor RsiW
VIDCMNTEVRDALPDLLNGRLSKLDTATMNAHVESCAACRSELALLREARASSLLTPALDIDRMAAAIPPYGGSRVTLPAAREQHGAGSRLWKFAAAAVLVVAGGWIVSTARNDAGSDLPRAAATSPAAEQVESSPDASPSSVDVASGSGVAASSKVPGAKPAEVQVASLSLVEGMSDISDSDLEQLVADLDAIDAIPADEPTPVTITVDDIDAADDQ